MLLCLFCSFALFFNLFIVNNLKEHFIGVLSHLTSGSSNELIPTFAAVQGELPHFVNQLIKFNELSRQINQNDGVSPHAKALIFDLTFVILCSIVQNYGSDVSMKYFKLYNYGND